jgi:hypothetical protein
MAPNIAVTQYLKLESLTSLVNQEKAYYNVYLNIHLLHTQETSVHIYNYYISEHKSS